MGNGFYYGQPARSTAHIDMGDSTIRPLSSTRENTEEVLIVKDGKVVCQHKYGYILRNIKNELSMKDCMNCGCDFP